MARAAPRSRGGPRLSELQLRRYRFEQAIGSVQPVFWRS